MPEALDDRDAFAGVMRLLRRVVQAQAIHTRIDGEPAYVMLAGDQAVGSTD